MDSEFDQRLHRLFQDLDTSAQFQSRLLARVRADEHTLHPDQVTRLQSCVESEYRAARHSLTSWRRQLLGFLTLDALALGTTLLISEWVLSHLLSSVALGGLGETALNPVSRSGLVGLLLLLPVALLVPVVLAAIDYGGSPE